MTGLVPRRQLARGAVPRAALLQVLSRLGVRVDNLNRRNLGAVLLVGPTGRRMELPNRRLTRAEILTLVDELAVNRCTASTDRRDAR